MGDGHGQARRATTHAPDTRVRLRRGLAARLRVYTYTQIHLWFALVLVLVSAPGVISSPTHPILDRFLMGLAVAILLLVRIGIATDWLEATSSGLRWRSVFIRRKASWSDIARLEVAGVAGLLGAGVDAVRVHGEQFIGGYIDIHTSFQCNEEALAEFVQEANDLRDAMAGGLPSDKPS